MDDKLKNTRYIFNTVMLLLILVGLTITLTSTRKSNLAANLRMNSFEINNFDAVWVVKKSGTLKLAKTSLPLCFASKKQSHPILLSKKLPILNSDTYLAIKLKGGDISAAVDGKLIYDFEQTDDSLFDGVSINSWHLIPIDMRASQKTVFITIKNPIVSINRAILGDKNDVYLRILKENLYNIAACIITFIAGLILMFLYKTYPRPDDTRRSTFNLGALAVVASIWQLFVVGLFQFFIGNRVAFGALENVMMFATTVLGIKFIVSFVNKNAKCEDTFLSVFYILFAPQMILLIIGVMSICSLQFYYAVMFVLSLVFSSIHHVRLSKADNIKPSSIHIIIIFCFTAMIFLEIYNYLVNAELDYILINICLCAMCFFMGKSYIIHIYSEMSEAAISESYRKLSITDSMTGLLNKNDFLIYTDNFSNIGLSPRSFCIVIDMNDLKYINDTYGHTEGDRAIKILADAIKNAYDGSNFRKFRVGGDEFMIIARSNSNEIENATIKLRDTLREKSKGLAYVVSASVGYENFDRMKDLDIKDTIKRADQKMYAEKRSVKKGINRKLPEYSVN